jgi:hypothetical protein
MCPPGVRHSHVRTGSEPRRGRPGPRRLGARNVEDGRLYLAFRFLSHAGSGR